LWSITDESVGTKRYLPYDGTSHDQFRTAGQAR